MTSGERMVWAAEYVRARAAGHSIAWSAHSAHCAVDELPVAMRAVTDPMESARVEDMLSNGGDR